MRAYRYGESLNYIDRMGEARHLHRFVEDMLRVQVTSQSKRVVADGRAETGSSGSSNEEMLAFLLGVVRLVDST